SHDHLIGSIRFLSPAPRKTSRDSYTLIEAVEDGWWYSAVLPDEQLVVAYMTDSDIYAAGSQNVTDYWSAQLACTTHTKARATSYILEPNLRLSATNSSRLDNFIGRNWLAVGDAACAFDPLSSQGIYFALESGLRAAEAIRTYLSGRETALK